MKTDKTIMRETIMREAATVLVAIGKVLARSSRREGAARIEIVSLLSGDCIMTDDQVNAELARLERIGVLQKSLIDDFTFYRLAWDTTGSDPGISDPGTPVARPKVPAEMSVREALDIVMKQLFPSQRLTLTAVTDRPWRDVLLRLGISLLRDFDDQEADPKTIVARLRQTAGLIEAESK